MPTLTPAMLQRVLVLATGNMRLLSLTSRCLSRLHPVGRLAGGGSARRSTSVSLP